MDEKIRLRPSVTIQVVGLSREAMIEKAQLEAAIALGVPMDELTILHESPMKVHSWTRFTSDPTPEEWMIKVRIARVTEEDQSTH